MTTAPTSPTVRAVRPIGYALWSLECPHPRVPPPSDHSSGTGCGSGAPPHTRRSSRAHGSRDRPQHTDQGIAAGLHDHANHPGTAQPRPARTTQSPVAVDLYDRRMFALVVFTGANAPTTIERYPRGEAVLYGEYAVEHGIPHDRVLLETQARSTPENVTLTRAILAAHGVEANSAIVMSRPYQQRRAYTNCAKLWPELGVTCASTQRGLDDYVAMIGNLRRLKTRVAAESGRRANRESRDFIRFAVVVCVDVLILSDVSRFRPAWSWGGRPRFAASCPGRQKRHRLKLRSWHQNWSPVQLVTKTAWLHLMRDGSVSGDS